MPGTQSDIIRAVQNQGIYALHFSDAIEAVNINHTGNGLGVKIPEGLIIVSLDCVALDSFCARYMFKTVPMAEARQIKAKQHLLGEFMHRVPVAKVEGKNIVTAEDVDSPLFHYGLYNYAEKRDVGGQKYYITGREAVTGRTLVSLQGHFGSLQNGHFNEIITGTMYYNPSCFLWDMQKTCFTYIAANDQLFKTSLFKEMMQAFDENGDGMIDYDENGKHGFWSPLMRMSAYGMYLRNAEKFGGLKSTFQSMSYSLRFSEKKWNQGGYDFVKDFRFSMALATAFTLSRMPMENPDPFVPGMIWGNGKWPSLTFVNNMTNFGALYGPMFPVAIDLPTIYGLAFQYADKALNGGRYTGPLDNISRPQALQQYLEELKQGQQPLDFKVFVPEGFGKMGLLPVPNVTETNDPAKIFSAEFDQGKVLWTSDFNL